MNMNFTRILLELFPAKIRTPETQLVMNAVDILLTRQEDKIVKICTVLDHLEAEIKLLKDKNEVTK